MNKELFVSSTPHETKVGLMEDDLLAEIYLERENEYTLAGSIYKGRVTRVLPGMQSAFVDIGLERDAFLYVSDFMELEEHDEDLTDVVPANRGVQDLRQPAQESGPGEAQLSDRDDAAEAESFGNSSSQDFVETEEHAEIQSSAAAAPDSPSGGASQDRDRGGYRGRRRRRGGRRDGRGDSRGEARGDSRDRGSEPRLPRPVVESAPIPPPAPTFTPSAPRHESGRSQQFGPPAGYQPILLPGESISKYRGLAPTPVLQEGTPQETPSARNFAPSTTPANFAEPVAPLFATFPEDEPVFASAAADVVEAPRANEPPAEVNCSTQVPVSEASTTVDWNRKFHREDLANAPSSPAATEAPEASAQPVEEEEFVEEIDEMVVDSEEANQRKLQALETQTPAFAAPGTLEEETIDEEEADAVRYEQSSDEGYEE